ncbi:MAG: anthranilate phosphoribosyltransferase [Candidatus Marinimicrobia bacterium]|nr:anthranilate phosphoribosyltransferase [Candidatus Neomarinimicrobiota bacterium]
MIKEQLEKIAHSRDLSRDEAAKVLQMIIDEQLTATEIGAFLFGLRIKGESVDEIQGFIDTMQQHMIKVTLDDHNAIDICGTGGDNKHSFNVSTTAAIVIASGDVSVAKHGNRSVSSKTGSADVLEILGVRIDLSPEKTKQCVDEIGFGFFFAPLYHPAMKAVVPHRKNLATRTVFNMLGPLLNPAGVKRQLIGTFNRETAQKTAAVLKQRNYLKACVVHSDDGFDEISPFTDNRIFEVDKDKTEIDSYIFTPVKYSGIFNEEASVQGGDGEQNAIITLSVLRGENGIPRAMTILNAAFGLYVGDRVKTINDGISLATELIDNGNAMMKLNEVREFSNDLAN